MTDKILTSYSASAQIEGFNSIALDGYGYSVRLHLQGWLGILFNIVSYRAKIFEWILKRAPDQMDWTY